MQNDRAIPLVILATLVVFGSALLNGFVWDDRFLFLADGRSLGQLLTTGFWAGSDQAVAHDFYRPVVSVALWMQRAAFGEGAFGYHLISVLLHAACAVLAFRWVQRRVGRDAVVPALLAALLFVAHPSRVESVAWISGSTDLWLTFWLLLGFEAHVSRLRGRAVLAFGCWLLAALSKETGILVPLLVAGDRLLLAPRGEKAGWRFLVPAGAAALVAVILRTSVVASPGVGALPGSDTAARVLASIGFYTWALLWPWKPTVTVGTLDPAAEGAWLLPGWAIAAGALVLVAIIWAALAARKSPALRPWLADATWLAVPLLPVLNLFPLGYQTFIAERFLYLPMLGACALVARGLVIARDRSRSAFRATAAAMGALLLAFAAVSTSHMAHFFDDVELFAYERDLRPDDARVGKWLAQALAREGRIEEAKAQVLAALEQAPQAWSVLRAELAVEWGVLEASSGPDAEQERLVAARALLDTLAEPPSDRIVVGVGGERIELLVDERVRTHLAGYNPLRDHRILAHLRTLNFDFAESLAKVAADATGKPSYAANYALVLLAQEKWLEAEAALHQAVSTFPGNERLGKLTARLSELRRGLGQAQPPESAALRSAFLSDLGAREAARRVVSGALAASPDDPRLVEVAVRIDLDDGMPALARSRLERLLATTPHARWQQLLDEVALHEQPRAALASDL